MGGSGPGTPVLSNKQLLCHLVLKSRRCHTWSCFRPATLFFWLWCLGDVWACAAKVTYCNKSNYCSSCLLLFGAHSFALLDKEIHLHPCGVRRSHKTCKFVQWEKRVCTNVLVFLSLWEPVFHSEGLHLFQGFLRGLGVQFQDRGKSRLL